MATGHVSIKILDMEEIKELLKRLENLLTQARDQMSGCYNCEGSEIVIEIEKILEKK